MIEKILEDGAKVFDVRTASECAEGSFENAIIRLARHYFFINDGDFIFSWS